MKIKVCGLNNLQNMTEVLSLKPDYIGLIFYPHSPRAINGAIPALTEQIRGISGSQKTGIFVNECPENIYRNAELFALDAVQLHGNESPDFCALLQKKLPVIKAFQIDENFDFSTLSAWMKCCSYFLFDTKSKNHGGSGKVFDWRLLSRYTASQPFFLSGGISKGNLTSALAVRHPSFYGLDLNSRFETMPGIKNIQTLKPAIYEIRNR